MEMDIEVSKQGQEVIENVKNGHHRLLIPITSHQQSSLMLVCKKTIAETQMEMLEFGALLLTH